MKIGPLEPKNIATAPAAERKPAPGLQPNAQSMPEASAKVELSSAASGIAPAEGDGSFDKAKVERIAQAIRDGKFSVDADAIADKLIANAQELLGRRAS